MSKETNAPTTPQPSEQGPGKADGEVNPVGRTNPQEKREEASPDHGEQPEIYNDD